MIGGLLMEALKLSSRDFEAGGWISRKNSARGENRSPALTLEGIAPEARSLAITMDDASHPLFKNYNHWVIWNLPVQAEIPGSIPSGKSWTAWTARCRAWPMEDMPTKVRNRRLKPFIPIPLPLTCWTVRSVFRQKATGQSCSR